MTGAKGSNRITLSFLYCGDWGSKHIKYSGLVTKYVNKVLLGFPLSSRLSELLNSFKLMVILGMANLRGLHGSESYIIIYLTHYVFYKNM